MADIPARSFTSSVIDGTQVVLFTSQYLRIETYISRTEYTKDTKNQKAGDIVEKRKLAFIQIKSEEVKGSYRNVEFKTTYDYDSVVLALQEFAKKQKQS